MRLARFLVAFAFLVATGPVAIGASPEKTGKSRPQRKTYLFNIPAQTLPRALEAFGIVTGHQLIYDSRLAASHQSMAVTGVFEAEAALRILLSHTDLTIRYTGPQDVAILPPAGAHIRRRSYGDGMMAPGNGAGALEVGTLYVEAPIDTRRVDSAQAADYRAYGQILRSEIRRALDADQETTRRNYHVQFDVWIDPRGHVGRTATRRSSGKEKLDREIRRVVARLVISRPPPGSMPQPVRISILSL